MVEAQERQRYASNDVRYNSLRADYKTPPEIYNKILEIFNREYFDFDVACTEHNIPANTYFTKQENGLEQSWFGVCFCNPPWNKTKNFMEHAMNQPDAYTCFVVASDRFYVDYMQKCVINNPRAVFLVLPKKQGFIIPGEEDKVPVPSVGTSVIIICPTSEDAESVKDILNVRNLFNTTAFKGGGVWDKPLFVTKNIKGNEVEK